MKQDLLLDGSIDENDADAAQERTNYHLEISSKKSSCIDKFVIIGAESEDGDSEIEEMIEEGEGIACEILIAIKDLHFESKLPVLQKVN